MSDITNCVLLLANSDTVGIQLIESKTWISGSFGTGQNFLHADVNASDENGNIDQAGGSGFFESDLYLMAASSIKSSDVADWFMNLPWGQHDEAVLSISGNDRGYVCIRGENGRAERTEWFT